MSNQIPVVFGEDRLLRVRDVAQILGVSRGKVHRMLHDGMLAAVRIGNGRDGRTCPLRVRVSVLAAWIRAQEVAWQQTAARVAKAPTDFPLTRAV